MAGGKARNGETNDELRVDAAKSHVCAAGGGGHSNVEKRVREVFAAFDSRNVGFSRRKSLICLILARQNRGPYNLSTRHLPTETHKNSYFIAT